MQKIAEIIGVNSAPKNTQRDSSSLIDAPNGRIYSDEAEAQGLTDLPPKKLCEFCGEPLKYKGFNFGTGIMWSPLAEPCKCPEGAAKYKKDEAERKAKREAEQREKEAQKRRERLNQIVGASGMGTRFLSRTFETFTITVENKQAAETAWRYAENFEAMIPRPNAPEPGRNGLIIVGPPGTGKTHLAAAIANKLINDGRSVICMTMIDILESIRKTFNGCGSEAEIIRRYKTVPLFIVDDMGKEPPTEWAISTIYNIINGRYEAYLPTIVTSNYSGSELEARMTPRDTKDSMTARATLDRIAEMCRAIALTGESWRKK